jgi:hypothetical protein
MIASPTLSATLASPCTLSSQEISRLRELEAIIEEGLDGFLKVGAALASIRDARETHPTFQSYCLTRWALSLSRCNQLIQSTKVYGNLTSAFPEDVPVLEETNESALRPLTRLDPELQTAVWQVIKAIEERPTGKTIADTVATIRAAIDEGWRTREQAPITSQTAPRRQSGDRRNAHRVSHQPRMSDLLAGLVKWSNRVANWNAEAIIVADDEICLERHLRAARVLNEFCVSIMVACNERKTQRQRL